MSTKDTIRIVLNGGADERIVALRHGKCVLVSATGNGSESLTVSSPQPASLIADHQREVTSLKRQIRELEEQLKAANDEKAQLQSQKARADELLTLVAKSDYVGSLTAMREATAMPTLTELETRCFIKQCNVELIKSKLDGYLAMPRCRWKENYWCIVWQIFTDLSWWKRENTLQDFVDWVTQSGHALAIDNFKHAKIRLKARLLLWYSPSGDDDFAVTAHALRNLFIGGGGGSMPSTTLYENDYVDHTDLRVRIRTAEYERHRSRSSTLIGKGVLHSYGHLKRHAHRYRIAITEARNSALEALGIDDAATSVPGLHHKSQTGKARHTWHRGRKLR